MEAPPYKDHYATLGVRRAATIAEIRRAYRQLVLRYHPDRHPTETDANQAFQKITEAYKVLSDPARRRAYDGMFTGLRTFQPPSKLPSDVVKTAAPSRLRDRLSALNAQNPLLEEDARQGAIIAAAIFPWLVSHTAFVPAALQAWEIPLLSFLLGATAFLGWHLGAALRGLTARWMEFVFRLPEIGEFGGYASPFVFAALVPTVTLAALQTHLAEFPLTGLFPAVFGGCGAAWVGAAIGRAFTFADDEPRRFLGALVGSFSAGVLGAMTGFLMTAATSDVLGGARFFSLWSCSGGASAAGAALAAVYGAWRKP